MRYLKYIRRLIAAECLLLALLGIAAAIRERNILPTLSGASIQKQESDAEKADDKGWAGDEGWADEAEQRESGYIKWVEFHAPEAIMTAAYELDAATLRENPHLSWIDLLAYLAARHGGEFPSSAYAELEEAARSLRGHETTIEELTEDLQYFPYYREAYSAVLDGFVGEYAIQRRQEDGTVQWESRYGLKAFSPIAKGFYYEDYDDFGASRSYGYARPHLGHDMMGQIGTPIIAIESGYVEALGWNRYGGWRIGIRSFDRKRYYYYAHLRQNFPYNKELREGSVVTAGDVIGYMGHTGYSDTENVNNIKVVHLHWGLQLIFDESQKEGDNEIWIDCYQLTKFLYKNRSETAKDEETGEWRRIYEMKDPAAEAFQGNE